jgi:hypothetical protein
MVHSTVQRSAVMKARESEEASNMTDFSTDDIVAAISKMAGVKIDEVVARVHRLFPGATDEQVVCALETAFDAQVKALESEDENDALRIPGRVSNAS